MIDKDLNCRFRVAISESANGWDKQNHVSQTRKANQENLFELNLGGVWRTGHFTALSGKTLSEEKDDTEIWNV